MAPLCCAPLLVALAALAPAASARDFFSGTTNVSVGVLEVAANLYAPSQPELNQWYAAAELAILAVNADPTLLPNHTLVSELADAGDSDGSAFYACVELARSGAAFLVGDADSRGHVPAYVSSVEGVNYIDKKLSSVVYNAPEFAYTHRLRSTTQVEARDTLRTCQYFGWSRIGILVDTSEDTTEQAVALRQLAGDFGIEVAETVQITFDPTLGRTEDLGDLTIFFDRMRSSRETRVWVFLVSVDYSARTLLQMSKQGPSEGFQYVIPGTGFPDIIEVFGLFDELRDFDIVFRRGDLILISAEYSQEPGPVDAWGARLRTHMALNTSYEAENVIVDPYLTRRMYDAVIVGAVSLHNLWEVKTWCAAAANATAHDNCTALAAEGDDDVSLRRLLRTTVVSSRGNLGYPIAFHPVTGERVTSSAMLQMTNGYIPADLLLFNADGTTTDLRSDRFWPEGSDGPIADRPAFVPDVAVVSDGALAVVIALCGLGVVVCLACAALTLRFFSEPIIRMSSPRMNLMSIVGGVALLCAPMGHASGELTPGLCAGELWTTTLGFTVLFGPLFAKLWRVQSVFNQKQLRTTVIRDSQLASIVAAMLAVDLVILASWQAASPMRVRRDVGEPYATADPAVYRFTIDESCESSGSAAFSPVMLVWKTSLLLWGSVIAVRTRNVQLRAINDSKYVGLAVYTTTVTSVIIVPTMLIMGAGDGQRDATYVLGGMASFIAVTSAVSLISVPKFWALFSGDHKRWTVEGGGASRMSTGGTTAKSAYANQPVTSAAGGAARGPGSKYVARVSGRVAPAPTDGAAAAVSTSSPRLQLPSSTIETA